MQRRGLQSYAAPMFRNSLPRIAALFVALLLWQAGMQLVHAAVFHSSAGSSATEHHQHAAAAVQVEAAPCHGDSATAQPQTGAPDCCDSLACQCACVHASLGGATFALMLPVIPDHPASLGTDTPALAARSAELFRPPI